MSLSADTMTPAEARQSVASFLGHFLRVTLTDQRTLTGKFICVDHNCSLVLDNAEEAFGADKRFIGSAVIAKQFIQSIEVDSIAL
ncbi:hypothetical protein H696_03160 [Fonticula alba]|uniref:Sm domain-containing protein n=1 Tax=Fonticula alba TaxID=691883 RepID=A0A058Z916_FONAL|nr:hypothetical protein H696_03160 [Fonticula alba]KCV70809.1 hypothetical protein H696_03160 [Fonticula alba]|eukprot:XP_009495325.1 hypothetical protein H696_03160 [Fonticula alba]